MEQGYVSSETSAQRTPAAGAKGGGQEEGALVTHNRVYDGRAVIHPDGLWGGRRALPGAQQSRPLGGTGSSVPLPCQDQHPAGGPPGAVSPLPPWSPLSLHACLGPGWEGHVDPTLQPKAPCVTDHSERPSGEPPSREFSLSGFLCVSLLCAPGKRGLSWGLAGGAYKISLWES